LIRFTNPDEKGRPKGRTSTVFCFPESLKLIVV
jgi:hypothetical protein